MTIQRAADAIGVTRKHLSLIVNGKAGVTADMAMRLSKVLGTSPDMWLGLQIKYDLWRLEQTKNYSDIERIAA